MGFKILKDAGVVPPEVELKRQIEALSSAVKGATDDADVVEKQAELSQLRQRLAMGMERLKG
jgi:hypothetical protein